MLGVMVVNVYEKRTSDKQENKRGRRGGIEGAPRPPLGEPPRALLASAFVNCTDQRARDAPALVQPTHRLCNHTR